MDPQIIILLGFGVLMYLMVIRPQKKRAQEHAALMASLDVGTDVITVGGIHGSIVELGDATVDLEVTADGIVLRFARSAVASVVRTDDGTDGDDDDTIDLTVDATPDATEDRDA